MVRVVVQRDWFDWVALVSTAFAAVGTVTAVVVALVQSRRQFGKRYNVSLETDPDVGSCTAFLTNAALRPILLDRVIVSEPRRKARAEKRWRPPELCRLEPGHNIPVHFSEWHPTGSRVSMTIWDIEGEVLPYKLRRTDGQIYVQSFDRWWNFILR